LHQPTNVDVSKALGVWRLAAGCHGYRELRTKPFDDAIKGLGHATDGLGQAEGFLDLFPATLRQGITCMSCRSTIDGVIAAFRTMRGATKACRMIAAWRGDCNHHHERSKIDGLARPEYHQSSRERPPGLQFAEAALWG
jgi:hypothetical protein